MADDVFFNRPEEKVETPETVEPEKTKVGEKEYTQEELNRIVQLGEIGREAEEKYNVKIDKIWPNHQATINEKKQLEQEIENLKQAKVATKVETGVELTPDELKAQAKKEAKALDIVTTDEINDYIDRRLEAREIRLDTQTVVSEASEKYGIETDEEAILNHMIETGIRNPEKAFKDLYEDKIDAWKEKQIDSVKKPGMVTDSASSAGSKQPSAEPISRDNFFAKVDEVLDRQS